MTLRLRFTTLDVFTSQHFAGNPLAIVRIPKDFQGELSQTQKQTIAREFNLSETVFLHEGDLNEPVRIDIFTTDTELPFAGHPTVGSGRYLLSNNPRLDQITLKTKAGDIPVFAVGSTGESVRLRVPTNFRVHPPYVHPRVKVLQPHLVSADYANGLEGEEAIVSIVKGMTFFLPQLNSEDALSRLQPSSERLAVPELGEWTRGGFVGMYAFYERQDGIVRTRMFAGTLEDPATGSAASTLAGWLAKKRGAGTHKIEILQGVEMGRRSEIVVVVDIGRDGEIISIELSGSAVEVMEGTVRGSKLASTCTSLI